MPAPEQPFIQGTITAVGDGDLIPLSTVDLYAIWVSTAANIVTAAGVVTFGPLTAAGAAPVNPPSFLPPIPPLVPQVGYRPYYNLKNLYAKFTKATDSLTFSAMLPQGQPAAQNPPLVTLQ